MNDVGVAIALAGEGAAVVRHRFGTNLERQEKGKGDFTTNADVEAENVMLAFLRRERPNDAILGEETGSTGESNSPRTWLIDPLCGTLNYAVKMRVAAVNVALRVEREFVAAAVADPFNEEIFWTDSTSAFLRIDGQDTPLCPSGRSKLVDLNFDPPFSNAPAFTAAFRPRVVSTTIALAWVASGQRAAYITDGDMQNSVHFAAGLAICQGAGCIVTDLRGSAWGNGPTGLLAAADSETHAALMRVVRKYLI
jgi:myo-inositol-1(or 4)-monophosphatase